MDVFCKILNGEIPSKCFYEDEYIMCIMDANPESSGHSLIIPKNHYENILKMDKDIFEKVCNIAQKQIAKMEEFLPGITGVKVVVNYGAPQVVKHFHMHLIPTYIGSSKLTQDEAYEILKNANL